MVRLRQQLATAEGKEREASVELARAAAAKAAATQALAQAEGVKNTGAQHADGPSVFGISMNMDVFDSFESWECEESEKQEFMKLKAELETHKATLEQMNSAWQ